MGYIEKNILSKDETVVFVPEKSKIVLVWSWVLGIVGFWLLLIPTILAIITTIRFHYTEFAITNKKIIEKYGWLNTHCDEMLISHVENITVTKSFFGTIFHYGTVCIQGNNRNNINFMFVKNPERVRKEINDILSK